MAGLRKMNKPGTTPKPKESKSLDRLGKNPEAEENKAENDNNAHIGHKEKGLTPPPKPIVEEKIVEKPKTVPPPPPPPPKIVEKAPEPKPEPAKPIERGDAGWLIVHTENLQSKSFSIPYDKDIIVGRKTEHHIPDIAINFEGNNDPYFSRKHLSISAIEDAKKKRVQFFISDLDSKNGTFLNGKKKQIASNKKIEIKDGDTIQAGETKLVLKSSDMENDIDSANKTVIAMKYSKTVEIE